MKTIIKLVFACSVLMGAAIAHAHSSDIFDAFKQELAGITDLAKLEAIKKHLDVLTSSESCYCTKPECSWCNHCTHEELEHRRNAVLNHLQSIRNAQSALVASLLPFAHTLPRRQCL